MNITKHALLLAAATGLLLAACRTPKVAVNDGNAATEVLSAQKMLSRVNSNRQTTEFITAKLKFSADIDGKGATVSGMLRMKRDDVIRIQLMALGVMEVGRLEFTPDYVLIMDRVNKQYIQAAYDDVDFLESSGISFYTLQALFWNELFQPGHREPVADAYTMKLQQDHVTLDYARDLLSYQWLVDRKKALIEQVSAVHGRGNDADKATLSWHYANFSSLEHNVFPCDQQVTFAAKKRNVKMGFLLSSLSTDSDWETRTKVSSRYKKVTIDEVLDKIASMGV